MSLTTKQIQHIANLARLNIEESEMDEYSKKLSPIIDYIGQLQEVDITDIEPTAQVTGLENIMREDLVNNCDEEIKNAVLKQSAEIEDDQIKVKRILN